MKQILALLVLLSSSASMACIPSGDRLTAAEKRAFAVELLEKNPVCYNDILDSIGNLTSNQVMVIENVSDMKVEFSVRGRMRMRITKMKINGKIGYLCGPVGPLTRGC